MCRGVSAMFLHSIRLLLLLGFVAALTRGAAPECKHSGQYKLPDPDSCKHYYQCKDGEATRAVCSLFAYFDNVVMDCQKMWIVDCEAVPPEFPPAVWWQDN